MTQREQVHGIYKFLRRLYSGGELIEIRGLYPEKPINPSSWYARDIEHDDPLRHVWRTAADRDILCRFHYLIDVDPVRETSAATPEQRQAAIETAQQVRDYLRDNGWSEPIAVIDSGNGVHLLYRGDGCSADDSILKFALKALAMKFNGACKIDTVVGNPARISRMPYTKNLKAGRMASVIEYPGGWQPVPPWKVYHLALEGGYRSPYDYHRSTRSHDGTLLIDEEGVLCLIDEFPDQLLLDGVSQKDDATYFALESCPFKGAPHRGQEVGFGKTTIILRPNSIGFNCFSDDCADHTFTDLLRLLHEQTGRWPSMPIWEDDMAALEARWGGVDDLSPRAYVSKRFEEGQPNIEGIPFEGLFRPFVAIANAEYQVTPTKLRALFNEQVKRIVKDKDLGEMARYLGAEMVADIRTYPVSDGPKTFQELHMLLGGGCVAEELE